MPLLLLDAGERYSGEWKNNAMHVRKDNWRGLAARSDASSPAPPDGDDAGHGTPVADSAPGEL